MRHEKRGSAELPQVCIPPSIHRQSGRWLLAVDLPHKLTNQLPFRRPAMFLCSRSRKCASLNDTLVGPLGRCVGANDHALFVCSVAALSTRY